MAKAKRKAVKKAKASERLPATQVKKPATKKKSPPGKTKSPSVRKKPTVKSGAPPLRVQLDRFDRELVKMLNQRSRLALKVVKEQTGGAVPPGAPLEDADIINRLAKLNKGPLPDRSVRAVFRELASGSRSLARKLTVAFLGPLYTYSHLAAIHRFGQSVELSPVGSIAAVFEEVNRGNSDFGLVPIENSTDGRIADTLDMFTRLPVRICGEVELDINHALLGKCSRSEIREVYSRPQALSQCRNWLAKHLSTARTIEVTSTSTAAQLALEKPGAAAIASMQAGMYYGLDILAERIEDNTGNVTRFAVIGNITPEKTGNDRTAIMFQTEHRFGALADALNVFKLNRVNLTWIESFPIPDSRRTYLFFVELVGHESDPPVRRCAEALTNHTLRLVILGSFPAAVPDEEKK
jgi:chorismate mutase / prephenate dehydratase